MQAVKKDLFQPCSVQTTSFIRFYRTVLVLLVGDAASWMLLEQPRLSGVFRRYQDQQPVA